MQVFYKLLLRQRQINRPIHWYFYLVAARLLFFCNSYSRGLSSLVSKRRFAFAQTGKISKCLYWLLLSKLWVAFDRWILEIVLNREISSDLLEIKLVVCFLYVSWRWKNGQTARNGGSVHLGCVAIVLFSLKYIEHGFDLFFLLLCRFVLRKIQAYVWLTHCTSRPF